MQANSHRVTSNQPHLHHKLAAVVQRHLNTSNLTPVSEHSRQAYQALSDKLEADPRPLVLDSFCGTGHSTAALAARHPGHLIVGIDKSAQRLGKHPGSDRDNYLLLRANCEDIWALLIEDRRQLDFHYLLYPNPWPKSSHLQRRIHGHASFPQLLQLGGQLELRSNWQVYVEEFGFAMHLAGHHGSVKKIAEDGPALTLFEQKYRQSGHLLWAYTCRIMP